MTDNARLKELHDADQNDRAQVYDSKSAVEKLKARDKERRNEVMELMVMGKAASSSDLYHAAVILQHSNSPKDFLTAHRIATMSAVLGHEGALFLVGATLDRFLMSVDQPQVYSTQFEHRLPENRYSLKMPLDDSTVMSFEKKFFKIPKAADRLAELNSRIEGRR